MKKIKLFLASSNTLVDTRRRFELEIYRKCKLWFEQGVFLHLDVWEDLSARMSEGRSQDEYNEKIEAADLFVLLASDKVGMYSAEEFDTAFGAFKAKQKPFVFTYFLQDAVPSGSSLELFKKKLSDLGHFYASYKNDDDLWNQFNKELERLQIEQFKNKKPAVHRSTGYMYVLVL